MKLVECKAELVQQGESLDDLFKHIEACGRVPYKSEAKSDGTIECAKAFVERMIASKHCYTGDSEILTDRGWIKWKDYKGQQVAVINPDLSFKGFEVPSRVVKHTYTGTFYDYPALGIKVTDGHRMFGLHRTGGNNFYNNQNYVLFECNSLYKDQNGRIKTQGERMFKTPRHCSKPIHTNPYMELVGFWLGDGCYNEQIKNKLVFHLKKKRKIEYLKDLARQLGYKFTEGKNNYYKVEETGLGNLFNTAYYVNKEKYIGIEGHYSSIDIHSIITGLINSDGSQGVNTKTITYTSSSKNIIDWICTYAPLAGYTISYRGTAVQGTENQKAVYKVLFLATDYTINNDSRNENSKVIVSRETHDVFCVTISTGLIMVRGTNGITTICGNCSVLEHGTVYLKFFGESDVRRYKYIDNPYSKVISSIEYINGIVTDVSSYVTSNYRVLVENGWLDDLEYICEPTENHVKRYTFKVITSIGVTREFNRHRKNSILEMSTRYCNFSKDKFDNQVSFCKPSWLDLNLGTYEKVDNNKDLGDIGDIVGDGYIKNVSNRDEDNLFLTSCLIAEHIYKELLEDGWKPQQAREILPLCTATEAVYTGFAEDWKHFFSLRLFETTGKVHPNMMELSTKMREEAIKANIWDDIHSDPSSDN